MTSGREGVVATGSPVCGECVAYVISTRTSVIMATAVTRPPSRMIMYLPGHRQGRTSSLTRKSILTFQTMTETSSVGSSTIDWCTPGSRCARGDGAYPPQGSRRSRRRATTADRCALPPAWGESHSMTARATGSSIDIMGFLLLGRLFEILPGPGVYAARSGCGGYLGRQRAIFRRNCPRSCTRVATP